MILSQFFTMVPVIHPETISAESGTHYIESAIRMKDSADPVDYGPARQLPHPVNDRQNMF